MKKTLRAISLCLAAVMCLTALTSCRQNEKKTEISPPSSSATEVKKTTEELFYEYIDTLPTKLMAANDLNLHFFFVNPENFGFEEEPFVHPFFTKDEWDDSYERDKEILSKLKSFDTAELNEAARLDHSIFVDYFERNLLLKDYYYLGSDNYLGTLVSYQSQLPIYLAEYNFYRQSDLDSYFGLLGSAKEIFLKYAELEKERQALGYGMSASLLEGVIAQCKSVVNGDTAFLADGVNKKIDSCDFLSPKEREAAKEKNRMLLEKDFIEAYKALSEALEALREVAKATTAKGLASRQGGKEYYSALLKSAVGVDMTPTQAWDFLEQRQTHYMELLSEELSSTSAEETKASEPMPYNSFDQMLSYLSERMLTDFPKLDGLSYKINTVPEALSSFYSPASCFTPAFDQPEGQPISIYVNSAYSNDLISTLMHEGFPGHLYQLSYFKDLDVPLARRMLGNGGYVEGYANYIENFAPIYAPDQSYALHLSNRIVECLIALGDIGIHYEGWTKDEFYKWCVEERGLNFSRKTADLQYDMIVELPCNYMRYYLSGNILSKMYEDASAELGEGFDSVAFHKVILDTGATSFPILQTEVDKYVKTAKAALVQQDNSSTNDDSANDDMIEDAA